MAPLRSSLHLLLLAHFLFLTLAQDDASQLLAAINQYRTSVINITGLSPNAGATCLAKQVLTHYENTACTNSTGLDTVPGQEQDYPNFPNWLSSCNIPIDNAKDGQILPDCVPAASTSVVDTAFSNYTHSSGASYINETSYVSAGAAFANDWFVLVLATNSSTGSYQQTSGASLSPASLIFLLCSILGSWTLSTWRF